VADVSEWLRTVSLPQYVSSFAQNEISGGILLDVTLEDLDYMQITVLAHRKILLRGVEDLRRAGRFTEAPLSLSPQKGPGMLRTLSNPTLGDDARSILSQSQPAMHFSEQTRAQYVPQAQPSESKGTHWSHLEPLSNNKVRFLYSPIPSLPSLRPLLSFLSFLSCLSACQVTIPLLTPSDATQSYPCFPTSLLPLCLCPSVSAPLPLPLYLCPSTCLSDSRWWAGLRWPTRQTTT
jgi:hypothetical protein